MDKNRWQDQIRERLAASGRLVRDMTPGMTYGALSAATILPLVAAVGAGDFAGMGTLFSIVGGVGGNLIANQIQSWKERSESALAEELTQLAAQEPAWQEALDALTLALETPRIVQAILGEHEWDRFQKLLRQELSALGNLATYNTYLTQISTQINTGGGAGIHSLTTQGDFVNKNKITHIYHIYQSAPGEAQLGEEQFAQVVTRYLSWVVERYGQLNLRGVQRRERQPLTLGLKDVYVSLKAATSSGRWSTRRTIDMADLLRVDRKSDEEESQTLEDKDKRVPGELLAIIGGPGSGKTTFLHIIAASLAQALLTGKTEAVSRFLGLEEELPLPIFVTLSDYNRYRRQHENATDARESTLTAFLNYSLIRQEAALGLPADFFERLLSQGKRCIVLLDGLDEVADERERALVRQAVENLADNRGVGRMVVTSRSRAYEGRSMLKEQFRVVEVQPMSLEQVQALADRWCRAVYDATRAPAQSAALQEAIANLEALRKQRKERSLIDSPLMVTIVAIVHYNDRRLPDERADLYHRCVDVLLAESYKPESQAHFELVDWGGSEREKRSLLAYLAYCMMIAGEQRGRSVDEDQMRTWLRPELARLYGEAKADLALTAFIQSMRERGSLLDERDGRYQFIHLTFQEFLCAAYLVDTVRERSEIVRLLCAEGRIAQSWWRETVLLTVGYLGLNSIEAPLALLNALISQPDEPALFLEAHEVIWDAFMEQNGQDEQTQQHFIDRLVQLIQAPNHPGTPAVRAKAGRTLDRAGDPRPGVGLRPDGLPDITWVKIPERDAQGRAELLYGEKGERRTEPTFWMAKYPVTYRQFQAFVDDPEGMPNPQWWQGLARTDNKVYEQHFKFWNHPRENVSWYQVVAFCRWLTAKAEADRSLLPGEIEGAFKITLPTEWQWEKAARGHDGRAYPWGIEYIQGYANVEKDGPHNLQSTSAVGLYPQGKSPYGILDLSGNVWEWCLNEYDKPERIEEGGSAIRVLRGGSWAWEANRASASARRWYNPLDRHHPRGFRCVVVPISR